MTLLVTQMLLMELGRSSVVCAIAAGAASASARIEVATSFIGASVRFTAPRSRWRRPARGTTTDPSATRRLRGEARSAAARMLGVGVLEREPALPELPLDVVDLDPHQVHRAHRVDEAAHALDLEDKIAGALLLLQVEAVLEARAAASHDGDAEAGTLQVFAVDRLLHHRDGPVAQAHRRRRLAGGGGLRREVLHALHRDPVLSESSEVVNITSCGSTANLPARVRLRAGATARRPPSGPAP